MGAGFVCIVDQFSGPDDFITQEFSYILEKFDDEFESFKLKVEYEDICFGNSSLNKSLGK